MDIDFILPQLYRLISQVESIETNRFPVLSLEIWCSELDERLLPLAQVCSAFFPLSTLIQLDIVDDVFRLHWKYDMDATQWLEFLDPFTAVKDLRLSDQAARHVFQAWEELADERVTEVLPALQNIFLEGLEPLESVPKYIEGFVAARQLSGHPVAVHRWE
ncbi:hypothetical protein F5148DRAFT_1288558 [Russula earlei]|uniref:Uncharacterized protein n=1 Tax=Russula earlei TaxID=71964 RepID=A0ACC0U092_9AGAM|nr:hypothetical protein F5148DRAFT_1288558 [Russula earlei]